MRSYYSNTIIPGMIQVSSFFLINSHHVAYQLRIARWLFHFQHFTGISGRKKWNYILHPSKEHSWKPQLSTSASLSLVSTVLNSCSNGEAPWKYCVLAGHTFTQNRMGSHYKEEEFVGDWVSKKYEYVYTTYLHGGYLWGGIRKRWF